VPASVKYAAFLRPVAVGSSGKYARSRGMKRICTALVFLVVGVAVLGHFLGWYHVTSEKEGSRVDIHITVDEDKIHEDEVKAEQELKRYGQQFKEHAVESSTH
jgi:hypothetical protein